MDAAPHTDYRDVNERALTGMYLFWRAANELQAVLPTAGNLRRYRRPGLAVALAAGLAVEVAWSTRRGLRSGRIDRRTAWVDVAASAAALVLLPQAQVAGDRDRWRAWAFDFGAYHAEVLAVPFPRALEQAGAVAVLAGAHLAGQILAGRTKGVPGALLELVLLSLITGTVVRYARRSPAQLEEAHRRAVAEAEALARSRTLGEHHRGVHDQAKKVLAEVAAAPDVAEAGLRRRCAEMAVRLRMTLSRDAEPGPLEAAFGEVIEEAAARGVSLEVVPHAAEPTGPGLAVLVSALRETLAEAPVPWRGVLGIDRSGHALVATLHPWPGPADPIAARDVLAAAGGRLHRLGPEGAATIALEVPR